MSGIVSVVRERQGEWEKMQKGKKGKTIPRKTNVAKTERRLLRTTGSPLSPKLDSRVTLPTGRLHVDVSPGTQARRHMAALHKQTPASSPVPTAQ